MSSVSTNQIKTATEVLATGNTFQHRRELIAAGGAWDAQRKAWVFSARMTMAERSSLASLSYRLSKSGVRWEAI